MATPRSDQATFAARGSVLREVRLEEALTAEDAADVLYRDYGDEREQDNEASKMHKTFALRRDSLPTACHFY